MYLVLTLDVSCLRKRISPYSKKEGANQVSVKNKVQLFIRQVCFKLALLSWNRKKLIAESDKSREILT